MICISILELCLISITIGSVIIAIGLIIENKGLRRNKKDPE